MLPTLFTGYRSFADSFSRFLAGNYLLAPALTYVENLQQAPDSVKNFPKTTLPVCIELKECFQRYLLGIGVLRTRSQDF